MSQDQIGISVARGLAWSSAHTSMDACGLRALFPNLSWEEWVEGSLSYVEDLIVAIHEIYTAHPIS